MRSAARSPWWARTRSAMTGASSLVYRATTDQLLIVKDGSVRAFDGDLEDYRESLLNVKISASPPVKKQHPGQNLQSRIKRLKGGA